jgi:predicted  nucleic acid-binding Zn-ribbon protein
MSVLEILLNLNRKDSLLATLRARRARIEREFNDKVAAARELERGMRRAVAVHSELEGRVRGEERAVAEEEKRLVERRKALSSFSNYKVAQGAEREIEASSRELRAREEGLLKGFEELESAQKVRSEAEDAFAESKAALELLAASGREAIAGIDSEIGIIDRERTIVLGELADEPRREYEKVVKKHPSDPVAEIQGSVCSGCRMSIGPQAVLSVRRGTITRCPGCGRILYASGEDTHQAVEG